ncbi:hypothetical protein GCM10017602_01250 [Herbiconiux flava]|nr:hypothetical protein GCM10017602_01250 [Herbiconiux flava]
MAPDADRRYSMIAGEASAVVPDSAAKAGVCGPPAAIAFSMGTPATRLNAPIPVAPRNMRREKFGMVETPKVSSEAPRAS